MKLKTKLSVVLLLLLLLLCACSDAELPPDSQETPVVTLTPAETPEVSPEPEDGMEILRDMQAIGVGNVFVVPNELTESSLQQDILRFGDDILAWSYRYGEQGSELLLSIIDTADGSVAAQRSLTGLGQANIQICGRNVVICDWSDGSIYILDESLQTTQSRTLGIDKAFFADPGLEFVYVFMSDKGIYQMPIFGDEDGQYVLTDVSSLYASVSDNGQVSFSCVSDATDMSLSGVLSLDSGVVGMTPFDGAFSLPRLYNDTWMAQLFGSDCYYIGRDKSPYKFTVESRTIAEMSREDGKILLRSYDAVGTPELSLYSIDGVFISSCSIDIAMGGIGCDPVWFEELCGYFFTVTTENGSDRLIFWDISVPTSGQDLELTPVERQENVYGSSVSQELYAMADEVSERHGVRILIAELCDSSFGDFYTTAVYDEEYIREALEVIDAALARFPAGFLDDLKYSVYTDTEIHLVAGLERAEEAGEGINFTSFVGAAVQDGTRNVIALDILRPKDLLEQSLYHELSHIIDKRLQFDSANRNGSFSEQNWSELNPDDFSYYERNTGIPADVLSDGFESYFIDIYSRTTASEDRARIFEYAMVGADWAFEGSPGRLAKLRYYCQCIRECFGNNDWADTMPWEIYK